MHETKQDGTKHCHQILISIDFETQVERNLNLSVEKSGVTQPLYQSYENVIVGKDSLEFLIKPDHLSDDVTLEDVDRIVVFLTDTNSTIQAR